MSHKEASQTKEETMFLLISVTFNAISIPSTRKPADNNCYNYNKYNNNISVLIFY